MDNGRQIQIRAVNYQHVATQQPLRWPAPIPSTQCNIEAYEYNWRRLQRIFPRLPDPRAFPPILQPFPAADREVLDRYCDHGVALGETSVLNVGVSMSVGIPAPEQEPEVETQFGSRESVVGFSTLFRQYYANDEPASFSRVQGILRKANQAASDDHRAERAAALRAWAFAQGQLRGFSLLELCTRAVSGHGLPEGMATSKSPEFVISVFNYGQDLHWGRQRETARAWSKEPDLEAHYRMEFFESAASLSFLYIGFASLVGAAIGR